MTTYISQNVISTQHANIMLFYTDWCPHCNKTKVEWDLAKNKYDGQIINNYTVHFIEYNCSNDMELGKAVKQYSIEYVPTIKLIKDKNDILHDYNFLSSIENFLHMIL